MKFLYAVTCIILFSILGVGSEYWGVGILFSKVGNVDRALRNISIHAFTMIGGISLFTIMLLYRLSQS